MSEIIYLDDIPPDASPRCAEDIVTPIDHLMAQRLIPKLLDHGAQVQQLDVFTYTARLPGGQTQERACSNHLIRFPAGTMRYDGLVLSHSRSFRLLFPDGFLLRGVHAWGPGEENKIILYVPKDDEWK
jgi:hypothetical protein